MQQGKNRKLEVENINNLDYSIVNDTSVYFHWEEPECDSLRYSGVYFYLGQDDSGVLIDTIYRGTTSYTYSEYTVISDVTFIPFDTWGSIFEDPANQGQLVKRTIENVIFDLEPVKICQDTSKVIMDFSDGIDPLWSQVNNGNENSNWNASDSGSSQWFSISNP